jgi:hypothetical protein
MRALEQQQAQELNSLNLPYDSNNAGFAVSAPTTPPRINAVLNGEPLGSTRMARSQHSVDAESLLKAVGSAADKRKSVTYAPSVNLSPELPTATNGNSVYARAAGARSMPASRRTSTGSHDEDIAGHLQNLSLIGEHSSRASPIPPSVSSGLLRSNSRYGDEGAKYASTYNAGMLLDEQLDHEMNSKFSSKIF